VVTTALAAVALDEFLTPVQLIGALLVLSSVAVLQIGPNAAERGLALGPSGPTHELVRVRSSSR
jgi:hypothetical protein